MVYLPRIDGRGDLDFRRAISANFKKDSLFLDD